MSDDEAKGWGAWLAHVERERAHEEALHENAAREYDKTLAAVKAMSDAAREALDRLDFMMKNPGFFPVRVRPAPRSAFQTNTVAFRDDPQCPIFVRWTPDRDRSAFIDYVPPGGTP